MRKEQIIWCPVAALQTSSPGESHGTSDATRITASQLHGEIPQTACTVVHLPEVSNLPLRKVAHVPHGLASLTVRARGWCLRFGMTASSWEGWAEQHVNPFVAVGYFCGSAGMANAALAYICTGVRGDDQMFYVVIVPLVSFVVMGTAIDCSLWRWGPAFVNNKLYQAVVQLSTLCGLPLFYMGYLGPEATVPWHDRFHFLCAHAIFTFFIVQKCTAGAVPGEQPTEPRTSIMQPFCRSAIHALMMLDATSDLTLSRSLLTAVCPQ